MRSAGYPRSVYNSDWESPGAHNPGCLNTAPTQQIILNWIPETCQHMLETLASSRHPPLNYVGQSYNPRATDRARVLSWPCWSTESQVPWPQKPGHFEDSAYSPLEEGQRLMVLVFWTPSWLGQPDPSLPHLAAAKVVKNAIRIHW